MRYLRPLLTLVALATVLAAAGPAAAQSRSDERCFPETGYCISGAIRAYWERNGGLAVFGYPITPVYNDTVEGSWTGPIQWFERDRLEDHANEGKGVLAGRLGARYLELQGRPWQQAFAPETSRAGCRYFPETRFNLCEPFLSYWSRNGGVERFGFPLSPRLTETIGRGSDVDPDGWTGEVQYFERRRLEWHTELAGTPYEYLLGLLGREVYYAETAGCTYQSPLLRRTWETSGRYLGCPRPYIGVGEPLNIATQPYERGWMVWLPGGSSEPHKVFVVAVGPGGRLSWKMYLDSYVEGEALSYPGEPPPGRVRPVRGFGKLWTTNAEVRQLLGWPTAAEQADVGAATLFNNGGWMIYRTAADRVYVLNADGTGRDLPRER